MEVCERCFFDVVTTHNDHPSYAKHACGNMYVLFHMSHNYIARNCFFLRVFKCSLWHAISEILRLIGRTAGKIAAEWSSRSPFSLSVPEVCVLKLVEKMLPMLRSNAADDCFRFRKQCLRTSLPMFGSTASDGRLPSYTAVLPEGCGQWHAPTRASSSQIPALIPWYLTKSCEPTHDTATHISAQNR